MSGRGFFLGVAGLAALAWAVPAVSYGALGPCGWLKQDMMSDAMRAMATADADAMGNAMALATGELMIDGYLAAMTPAECLRGLLTRDRIAATRARAAIRADLSNLRSMQEIHREDHGSYATNPDDLGFRSQSGVSIRLVHRGADGWAARGRSGEVECVVYEGSVPRVPQTDNGERPERAGEVICSA